MKKQKVDLNRMFMRSQDFYSKEDFKTIQKTKVLICGVGGMGGVCAELLVRTGFTHFTIADFDHFEVSNTNRQLYCNTKNVGKNKAMVLKREFLKINPKVKIKILKEGLTDSNRVGLVESHDIVVNGIDNPAFSVLLRRECFEQKRFMVDAWLTPAVCSFTVHPDQKQSPEDFMGYNTKHLKTSKEFSLATKKECLRKDIEYSKKKMNTEEILPSAIIDDILEYKYQRHFPAMVWMCGCLMALEVFKFVVKKGNSAPLEGVYYNYLNQELKAA